jgi:hypothetical protein
MVRKSWKPERGEVLLPFDRGQDDLYRSGSSACVYPRWPRSIGRSKYGEFPVVVTREHFRNLGYSVWASEPELPDNDGFILVSYPGKRRSGHPAYSRMESFFGADVLRKLNARADAAKRRLTGNAGGGDPDLFVFRESKHFFVEVKWKDRITRKQRVTFPLIERFCHSEVKVVRICPQVGVMEATAWSSSKGTFGIRIGIGNRDRYFKRSWTEVEIEMDGISHSVALTRGFWNKCPEFRDSGTTLLRDWLQRHRRLKWPTGHPPRFQLFPLGGPRFRLVA